MISLQDIRDAAGRLADAVRRTPFLRSRALSQMTGAEIWIKLENLQQTSSFKDRGAGNKMMRLDAAQRRAGVAAASAGNHAQAVAWHAARMGLEAVIVMPSNTPFSKVRATREYGARVVLHGSALHESYDYLKRHFVDERGMTLIHPYDDPDIIAGQGTVALEMLEDVPDLDTMVVPIGGGGLFSGMAVAAHAIRPEVEMVGVESLQWCSAWAAISGDESLVRGGPTIAEGIAVKTVGELTLPIIREHAARLVRVDEPTIERAVALLCNAEKSVAEGAGAAALAAVLADPAAFAGRKVGIVLSGGNIDPRMLAQVLLRQLVQESRLVALSVEIEDSPGFLGRVATCVGAIGGNIVQVHHERLGPGHGARGATLEMLIETQDEAHTQQIIQDLREAGFVVHRSRELHEEL